MKNYELIGVEELRRLFAYDPQSGSIKWKTGKQGIEAGAEFGSVKPSSKTAYRIGKVYRIRIAAHRLAWLLHYGSWPKGTIDHVNHNGLDNRVENLRDVDTIVNNKNASLRKNNTSGHVGISWDASDRKWTAQININKKRVYIGNFTTIEEAVQARRKASEENGYHKNHGMLVSQ